MAKFSREKVKEMLKSKNLTYQNLSDLTKISKSTISKLLGGFNANPTMKYLQKLAEALQCSIDDFFVWDTEPTSPYYLDRRTAEIAQDLAERPELSAALRAMRDLPPEDIKNITEIVEKMKK